MRVLWKQVCELCEFCVKQVGVLHEAFPNAAIVQKDALQPIAHTFFQIQKKKQ